MRVRDPRSGRALPADGLEVEDSAFWRERLADGSVVAEQQPATAPAARTTKGPARRGRQPRAET